MRLSTSLHSGNNPQPWVKVSHWLKHFGAFRLFSLRLGLTCNRRRTSTSAMHICSPTLRTTPRVAVCPAGQPQHHYSDSRVRCSFEVASNAALLAKALLEKGIPSRDFAQEHQPPCQLTFSCRGQCEMAPMAHDRKWRILKMGSHRPYLSLYVLALLASPDPQHK